MDPTSSRVTALRKLNRALTRATGLEVRKARPDADDTRPAPPGSGRGQGAGKGAGKGRGQGQVAGKAAGKGAGKGQAQRRRGQQARRAARPDRLRVSQHYDDAANDLIARVQPRTMTSPEKIYPLIQAVRYVVAAGIEGDFVEAGVWRGGSMQAIAWTLLAAGVDDRELHLFDTFEGMPPPGQHDRRTRDGATAEALLEQHDQSHRVWAYASLEDVSEGMAETAYPSERVHLVRGMVEETIPAHAPDRIAVLRLDTDWYASTKHGLEHLYPRLVPGGVLLLDDYGAWEGARKATEEYLASIDDELLLLPMAEGRIAVKPR
jgi:O-methyltransferase